MKRCVIKGTIKVIFGASVSEEVLLQNANNAGYTVNEVEILSEEEYLARLENEPKPIPIPTELEILRQEKEILAQSVYDLTTIVELILTGGIAE